MSAAVAIAASSNAAAIAAQQAAREAQETACEAFVISFDAKAAEVPAQQQYAECVRLLHPQPMSRDDIVAAKVAIVLLLVGTAAGAWRMDDDRVMGGMMGFMAALILGLVGLALGFLFTA